MRVLLFDIDGTLISTQGAGGSALTKSLCEQFDLAAAAQVPFSGRTDRGIGTNFFSVHGIDDTDHNWEKLRRAYLRELPGHLPDRGGRVLPGIHDLLARLGEEDDVLLGLLTGNLAEGARIKLEFFGIHHHFEFGGYGDHHRDRNDVARMAVEAARTHADGRQSFDRIWVIGDTPLDVQCAAAIDAHSVAVATGVHSRDELATASPDCLFDDLTDTDHLLELFRDGPPR